jgi:hypothetical protein
LINLEIKKFIEKNMKKKRRERVKKREKVERE